MLELRSRLSRSGLAREQEFALPLTQEKLANVLGLSFVHLNRTLQRLHKDGTLTWARGVITFCNQTKRRHSLIGGGVGTAARDRLPLLHQGGPSVHRW